MAITYPTSYQRVTTATDYDASAHVFYLRFDGVDDWLVTPNIDFTSTDKVTVFAGVRKNTLNAAALAELGSNVNTENGSFGVFAAGKSVSTDYAIAARGNITQLALALGFQPPITNIVAGTFDLSGDSLVLRVNKIQVAQSTSDLGSGNFGNYQLNIGQRPNYTAQFNGHLYSLIVRGAQSTAQQVSDTETYVNNKTKAY